jgi:hypothetical protein
MIKFLQKLALVLAKNANIFDEFFGENILKIVTSGPGMLAWNFLRRKPQDKKSKVNLRTSKSVVHFFVGSTPCDNRV